jgi:hypothetical protein
LIRELVIGKEILGAPFRPHVIAHGPGFRYSPINAQFKDVRLNSDILKFEILNLEIHLGLKHAAQSLALSSPFLVR